MVNFEIDPLHYIIIIGGALLAFYRFTVRPHIKKWGERLETVDKIPQMYAMMADIKKEVLPNGGSSLRDGVDRIERRIVTLEEKQNVFMRDAHHGLFETDSSGKWINVNRTLCRMLECSDDELLGKGWITFLKDQTVFDLLNRAAANEVEYKGVAEFITATGETITCTILASPMRSSLDKNFIGYLGIIDQTIA
jgi:PAS domain S-box-containing protein